MSREETHGGGEWLFSKCIWAPTYKKIENSDRRDSWPFWKNVLKIESGDTILHLRGKGKTAAFIGYSIAESNGHITFERPPHPGVWAYCDTYYRAFLKDYIVFSEPIALSKLFYNKQIELTAYYNNLHSTPKNLFFTIQSSRLQCLNGAYLTSVDNDLMSLIFGVSQNDVHFPKETISTAEAFRQVKQRIGQSQFSHNVKSNYNVKCCFPGCTVNDTHYLVASHIARWSDNPVRRGDTDNGLCFCLMHDKAFEHGYFSLDNNYCIYPTSNPEIIVRDAFKVLIEPYVNQSIVLGNIYPDAEALKEHRKRCNIII